MGRSEGDIALESWLFGLKPCSGQGQFTLTDQNTNRVFIKLKSVGQTEERRSKNGSVHESGRSYAHISWARGCAPAP